MPSPIRILQVVGGMNRGGVETWLMRVLRQIDRSRFHFDFLVQTRKQCAYDDEIRSLGAQVIPCLRPSRPLIYGRALRRVLADYGPYDVVHSHVYWFSGYVLCLAALAAIPRRIAHIYPLEDAKGGRPGRFLYVWAMRHCLARYATDVLADSEAALRSSGLLARCGRANSGVIYPGVDLGAFNRPVDRTQIRQQYGLPNEVPVVVYVARFVPHKNHIAVLNLARLLNANGRAAHFAMVGSHGSVMKDIQRMSQSRSDVSVLVGVPDVSDLLLASDIFVLPSLHEGFGLAAVEAQAAGLPVVATDLSTIREAVAPSMREFMFSPNALDAAAASLRAMIHDDALRRRLGEDGRRWSRRFDIRVSVSQLERLYSGERIWTE